MRGCALNQTHRQRNDAIFQLPGANHIESRQAPPLTDLNIVSKNGGVAWERDRGFVSVFSRIGITGMLGRVFT